MTGNIFTDAAATLPYLDLPKTGSPSLFWAELAKKLGWSDVTGYPENLKVDKLDETNVSWDGGYRKTHLYKTDQFFRHPATLAFFSTTSLVWANIPNFDFPRGADFLAEKCTTTTQRNRISPAPSGERNFYIYSFLIVGTSQEKRQHLPSLDNTFLGLRGTLTCPNGVCDDDGLRFDQLKPALKTVVFSRASHCSDIPARCRRSPSRQI